jgi:hypothetical protein
MIHFPLPTLRVSGVRCQKKTLEPEH